MIGDRSMKNEDTTPNGGWILLSEELPKENQKVWVTLEYHGGDRRCCECIYREGAFWESKYVVVDPLVKAWQPRYVPDPYMG